MSQGNDSLDSWEGQHAKASYTCPVSGVRLDQRAVRLVAGVVVTMLAAYAWQGWPWIPLALSVH